MPAPKRLSSRQRLIVQAQLTLEDHAPTTTCVACNMEWPCQSYTAARMAQMQDDVPEHVIDSYVKVTEEHYGEAHCTACGQKAPCRQASAAAGVFADLNVTPEDLN